MDAKKPDPAQMPPAERALLVLLLLVLTPLLFAVFNAHGSAHVLAITAMVGWVAAAIAILARQRGRKHREP